MLSPMYHCSPDAVSHAPTKVPRDIDELVSWGRIDITYRFSLGQQGGSRYGVDMLGPSILASLVRDDAADSGAA